LTTPRKEISKEELQDIPVAKYEGPIHLIDNREDIAACVERINKEKVIGIDTETKPSFRKGVMHRVALIQIATQHEVFLFRINQTGFSDELVSLLTNPQLLKVGIAFLDDIRDLQKIRPFRAKNVIDLNISAKNLGYESIGAKKLSALVLGFRISKRQQTSNWEVKKLSDAQLDYAATDAWICLAIYQRMLEWYPDLKNHNIYG
jgi:ribonuclease D